MEKILTEHILTKLGTAFVSLKKVEDKLDILTDLTPEPRGNPISEQARGHLREAMFDLEVIQKSLGK